MGLSRRLSRNLLGQSLVEILFAIAFAGMVIPVISILFFSSREGRVQQQQRVQAVSLLTEAQEAVRSVREKGWSYIATDGTFHPTRDGGVWSLTEGIEVVNGFQRKIEITPVFRDTATGQIVENGGVLDHSTKKITTTVSWSSSQNSSVSSTMYLTRYLSNYSYIETSQAQFLEGFLTTVAIVSNQGGEIQLSPNTKGQWCSPAFSITTLDLPKNGVANALWAKEGLVYAGTGDNSSGVSFAKVIVSNTDPPIATIAGTFDGYKTYDIFGDENERYAYIATDDNAKEVVIIDLAQQNQATGKYTEVGHFNTTTNFGSSANHDADSIFVMQDSSGSERGYVAAGNFLYVFDLSSKTGSRPRIGNRIQFANSGDKAGEIYGRIINNRTYIFIAIEGSTVEELKIAEVTNHQISSQWRIVGSINIEPNNCSTLESGKAVYVNEAGTRAYISSSNDAAFKEFFTIDTSNKSNPTLVGGFATNPPCTNGGGYETGGMDPEQSVIIPGVMNRAILVGVDTAGDDVNSVEYQVLDITNEANPTYCGGLHYDRGIRGVQAVREADGDAYAYIITGDADSELKIIQGGPDGNYIEQGTFESATFDAGYTVVFNRIGAAVSTPPQTTIRFQVAVANPQSGNCTDATWEFVGPDGTPATFFPPSGGTIPQNTDGLGFENPGKCIRYKAFLSTANYNDTPVIYDVGINYSP